MAVERDRRLSLHPVGHQFHDIVPVGRCTIVGTLGSGNRDRRALTVVSQLLGNVGGANRTVLVGDGFAVILVELETAPGFSSIHPNDQLIAAGTIGALAINCSPNP